MFEYLRYEISVNQIVYLFLNSILYCQYIIPRYIFPHTAALKQSCAPSNRLRKKFYNISNRFATPSGTIRQNTGSVT